MRTRPIIDARLLRDFEKVEEDNPLKFIRARNARIRDAYNRSILPVVKQVLAEGADTAFKIADALNKRHVLNSSAGWWKQGQIAILMRYYRSLDIELAYQDGKERRRVADEAKWQPIETAPANKLLRTRREGEPERPGWLRRWPDGKEVWFFDAGQSTACTPPEPKPTQWRLMRP